MYPVHTIRPAEVFSAKSRNVPGRAERRGGRGGRVPDGRGGRVAEGRGGPAMTAGHTMVRGSLLTSSDWRKVSSASFTLSVGPLASSCPLV